MPSKDSNIVITNGNGSDKPHPWLDEGKERETACILPSTITNPIQRIVITASGDLQRILSALYNKRIQVEIVYNDIVPTTTTSKTKSNNHDGDDDCNGVKDQSLLNINRQVDLVCNGKVVCKATSSIELVSQKAKELLLDQQVAIGQLFMRLGVNPKFKLLDLVFSQDDSSFYRLYSLSSSDLVCEIKEEFPAGMLESSFIYN